MHKEKQKPCRFFVVPGGGSALLGMSDANALEVVGVNNCNTEKSQARKTGGSMSRQHMISLAQTKI